MVEWVSRVSLGKYLRVELFFIICFIIWAGELVLFKVLGMEKIIEWCYEGGS